jgi:putative endonuclease
VFLKIAHRIWTALTKWHPIGSGINRINFVVRFKGMATPDHLLEGRRGERVACLFLLRHGFDVLVRRFRGRYGEIDLIALDGETLVFIEVKTRSTSDYGDPWEFVGWEKQQNLRRTAEEFIARHDLGRYAYRFDIVGVLAPGSPEESVSLYRNAF